MFRLQGVVWWRKRTRVLFLIGENWNEENYPNKGIRTWDDKDEKRRLWSSSHRAIDYTPTWFFVRILVSIYMLIGSRYKDSLYNVLLRLIFDWS